MRYLLPIVLMLHTAIVTAGEWTLDPAQSSLGFVVTYTGEAVAGRFAQFDTELTFDPDQPDAGQLKVTVDISSADMDSSDINEAIAGREWFDIGVFPAATFVSETIEAQDNGSFVARGTLELKGMRQPVDVPFNWQASPAEASMTGKLTLDRTAFSIGTGEWASGDLIGLDVRVEFDVTLTRPE